MPGRCVALRARWIFPNEPPRTTCVINMRHPRSWCAGGASTKMRLPQSTDTTSPTGVVSSQRGRESATRCSLWLLLMVPLTPPPVLGANVPPSDGEDSDDADSDATRLLPETQDEMEAEPAPPPAAGSSTDGVLQRRRWKQDILASEGRVMARMDKIQSYTRHAVESFDAAVREGTGEVQAKYRVALADFVRTCGPRRRGGAFPANFLKTNHNFEGFKLTVFEFRGLVDSTADNVFP